MTYCLMKNMSRIQEYHDLTLVSFGSSFHLEVWLLLCKIWYITNLFPVDGLEATGAATRCEVIVEMYPGDKLLSLKEQYSGKTHICDFFNVNICAVWIVTIWMICRWIPCQCTILARMALELHVGCWICSIISGILMCLLFVVMKDFHYASYWKIFFC